MADVTSNSKTEVTTDRTYNRFIPELLDIYNCYSPGCDARGFVVPSMARPVLTASSPCHTMATTGPDAMYLINPGKKGLPLRSA